MSERRRDRRVRGHGLLVRIRPGYRVALINVSRGGALVEAVRPLRPGFDVELQLERANRRGRIAARVVRCRVTAIHPDRGVTYRAGLSFNETCDWVCEPLTRRG